MIKIDKDIPLPPLSKQSGQAAALRQCKKGDSFVVELRTSIHTIASRLGISIATRREGDKFRVWRLS